MLYCPIGRGVLAAVSCGNTSRASPTTRSPGNYEPPVITRRTRGGTAACSPNIRASGFYLPSAEIPDLVKHAPLFPSAEDRNFYSHWGFDPEGIVRAGITSAKVPPHSGRLTITQQVAKNFLLNSDRTFERKIREILLSIRRSNPPTQRKNPRALPQ